MVREIALYVLIVFSGDFYASGIQYQDWTEKPGKLKPDILCPSHCEVPYRSHWPLRRCCACFSKPKWEIWPNTSTGRLMYEKTSPFSAPTLLPYPGEANATEHVIKVTGSFLTQIFDNICDFNSTLVHLDVSHNLLKDINGINCLGRLDTIIASYNQLTYISRFLFQGMATLRNIDLSHNRIAHVEPGALSDHSINIFFMDFSFNRIDTLDISNVIWPNATFCTLNFTSSVFGDISNAFDFKIEDGNSYGCGDILFDNCKVHNIFQVLASKGKDFFKYDIQGSMSHNNMSIPCDCRAGALLTFNYNIILKIYQKMIDAEYICNAPPSMKGIHILEAYNNTQLKHKFVCNETVYCPENCTCYEQPTRFRFVVNCSGQYYKDFPGRLPSSVYGKDLIFSSNTFHTLSGESRIRNISAIHLENNTLTSIQENILPDLVDVQKVVISDHALKTLPKEIRSIDANVFVFGTNGIPCDCSTKWMGKWRIFNSVNVTENPLFCLTSSGKKEIEKWYIEVDCTLPKNIQYLFWLIAVCLIVLLVSSLLFFCRQETFILLRRFTKKKRPDQEPEYDIFISFDEEDEDLRRSVLHVRKYMMARGYRVMVPCVDADLGEIRERLIDVVMEQSKAFLIVITPKYGVCQESSWTLMEYFRALHLFTHIADKNMILLNFDGCKIANVNLPYLKAFRRIYGYLNITNRNENILEKIAQKLGKPIGEIPGNE